MSLKLKLSMIIFAIVLLTIIMETIRHKKIPIKYALSWFFVSLIFILLAIFPYPLIYIKNLLGFETLANMILFLLVGLLLFITLILTLIVSSQRDKICTLIQEVSIIKNNLNNKNVKK